MPYPTIARAARPHIRNQLLFTSLWLWIQNAHMLVQSPCGKNPTIWQQATQTKLTLYGYLILLSCLNLIRVSSAFNLLATPCLSFLSRHLSFFTLFRTIYAFANIPSMDGVRPAKLQVDSAQIRLDGLSLFCLPIGPTVLFSKARWKNRASETRVGKLQPRKQAVHCEQWVASKSWVLSWSWDSDHMYFLAAIPGYRMSQDEQMLRKFHTMPGAGFHYIEG